MGKGRAVNGTASRLSRPRRALVAVLGSVAFGTVMLLQLVLCAGDGVE